MSLKAFKIFLMDSSFFLLWTDKTTKGIGPKNVIINEKKKKKKKDKRKKKRGEKTCKNMSIEYYCDS